MTYKLKFILLISLMLISVNLFSKAIPTFNSRDCQAANIFFEARGESFKAMQAVAATVLNRTKNKHYPKSICAVVFQPYQFSWTHQQKYATINKVLNADLSDFSLKDQIAFKQAQQISRQSHKEITASLPKNTLFYHANYVKPKWASKLKRTKKIGKHIYYAFK